MTGNQGMTAVLDEILQRLALQLGEHEALARALGAKDQGDDFSARLQGLAELGLEEFIEWIVGRRRFSSISESDSWRVLRLFLEVRHEHATVEKLVNELAIPEARATNMLSRMRYGHARELRAMGYKAALADIAGRLDEAKDEGGRKSIFVERETWDYIREAAWEIMRDYRSHAKKGKYEGAELPEGTVDRWGGIVKASMRMWEYIKAWLRQNAEQGGE